MKFKGVIKQILPQQSGTSAAGKEWSKVDFIVEEVGMEYPNSIIITAFGERVKELEGKKAGDLVTVNFDIRCREYNGRFFNSTNLYKFEQEQVVVGMPAPAAVAPAPVAVPAPTSIPDFTSGGSDDLPF